MKIISLTMALTQTAMSVLLLMTSTVAANSLGVGVGYTSEFPGSDDYQFLPTAEFEWDTPVGTIKNEQIGVQLDLIKSKAWDTGPIARINPGRNDSVSDELIANLPEVALSTEAGWFIGSGFRLKQLGINTNAIVIGRLSVVGDVGNGHGGILVNGSVGLVLQISDKLRFVPSVSFNYADDRYTQSFYGVDSGSAVTSGLTQFTPSGGLENTQLALLVIRQLNDQWSIKGTAAFNALQGDASNSPITQRGSERQLFTGVIANYRF